MRTERVFSVFWVEAVIAREISCDIEKEGGMTGVAVLVATEAIVWMWMWIWISWRRRC